MTEIEAKAVLGVLPTSYVVAATADAGVPCAVSSAVSGLAMFSTS